VEALSVFSMGLKTIYAALLRIVLVPTEICILNGDGYIPVTNQNARFRARERYQFKAILYCNGCSLIKSINDEVILLKRFFDGAKNNLFVVIKFSQGITMT